MEKKNQYAKPKQLFARTILGEIVEIIAYSNDITDLIRNGDDIGVEVESRNSRGEEITIIQEIKNVDEEIIKSVGAPNIVMIRTNDFGVDSWKRDESGEWY